MAHAAGKAIHGCIVGEGLIGINRETHQGHNIDGQELRQELICLLKRFDALLLPVTGSPAPEGLTNTGVPNPLCGMATFTGLPSISLPSGLSPDGMPLSVQLVGGPWEENRLLKAEELDMH